jgi:hypothetical protein
MRPHPPLTVALLGIGLLAAGAVLSNGALQYAWQAGDGAASVLGARGAWLWPAAALSGGCALALGAATAGLWRVRAWGWWLGVLVPLLAAAVFWGLRLAFERASYAQAARAPSLWFTGGGLALAWLVLLGPGVRTVYGIGRKKP